MFRAHIERTQMTQTFQGPQPLPDTVIFFCGRNCSLAACSCVAVLLHCWWLPVKCFCRVAVPLAHLTGSHQWCIYRLYCFKYLYYLSSFLIQNRPVLLLLLRLLHFSFSLPVSSYNTSSSILHFLYLRMLWLLRYFPPAVHAAPLICTRRFPADTLWCFNKKFP